MKLVGGEPLRAFEPLTSNLGDSDAVTIDLEVFAQLEAGDAGALPAFAALVGQRAEDGLASFRLRRLLNDARCTQIVFA